ncbi:hypothetical protein ES703_28314 [subsurface metagenome]
MSNKALIIFERRLEEWELAHPRQWISVTGGRDLANFISDQTNKIVKAQLKAADRIIVSQDRIADELSVISSELLDISGGIEEIQTTLDWGFSEVIWQLELQTEVIKNILKVIQAPLDTQAKELKERADEAYRNRWIDDALEDFLESEKKNRYDFTIHQSLGNIYLFHKKSPEKALEYYEKAKKYAVPYSLHRASLALLHIGLVKYLQEDFQSAYETTLEAIKLSPNFYEAHFQHAQYCANLGKYDESIDHLWEAIKGNRYYCVKADSEKDFNVMKGKLRSFFGKLQNKAKNKAKSEVKIAQELVQDAESYGVSTTDKPSEVTNKFEAAKRKLNEAETLLKRGSLFDCWDATYKALVAQKMATDASIKFLSEQILEVEKWLDTLIQKKNERTKIGCFWFWILFFFGPFYSLYFCSEVLKRDTGICSPWIIIPLSYSVIPLVIFSVIYGAFYYASWIDSLKYVPIIKKERNGLNIFKNNLSEAQAKQNQLQLGEDERIVNNADQLEKLFRKKYG